ncbi:hypothetical protein N7539_007886 [Penicillium diatomitis]|uniref:Uncharacterized protein n=1 Tax=Penicillium diatomitis TaxID=2819901 RepID=A0A9W9WU72_9EURO|nr:uncharacterized protein N7539_007886 [Penicillium diatomitis]KAJ5475599.1 hypothetical protein N7539_007886 [Penicillium diatomitis]
MGSDGDNQIPGVDDSEVGISDLGGPGYPWSSSAAGLCGQPSTSNRMSGELISTFTEPSPHFTVLGQSSSSQELAGHAHNPALCPPSAVNSLSYATSSAPYLVTSSAPWAWQSFQPYQTRLPSLPELGLDTSHPEPQVIRPYLPIYQYVNVNPSASRVSLTQTSPFSSLSHQTVQRHAALQQVSIQESHSSSYASGSPHNTLPPNSDGAGGNGRVASHLSDENCASDEDSTSTPGSAQAENASEFSPVCEFSRPCRMGPSPDGVHFRKVVSHLFGRNKASTKSFPESVWVFYCRKHYQRARYRAAQWPFNQCELLLQSLDRMERWGHVRSFELRLRRREALRTDRETQRPVPTGLLDNGRRHPTAFTAPVPDWLQREVGAGKSFDDIRGIVERIRRDMTDARQRENGYNQALADTSSSGSSAHRERQAFTRFPDIEILPTFHSGVLAEQCGSKRREMKKHALARSHFEDVADAEYSSGPHYQRQQGSRSSGTSRVSSRGQSGNSTREVQRRNGFARISRVSLRVG